MQRCPLCEGENQCQMAADNAQQGTCWCMTADFPQPLKSELASLAEPARCICQQCLVKAGGSIHGR